MIAKSLVYHLFSRKFTLIEDRSQRRSSIDSGARFVLSVFSSICQPQFSLFSTCSDFFKIRFYVLSFTSSISSLMHLCPCNLQIFFISLHLFPILLLIWKSHVLFVRRFASSVLRGQLKQSHADSQPCGRDAKKQKVRVALFLSLLYLLFLYNTHLHTIAMAQASKHRSWAEEKQPKNECAEGRKDERKKQHESARGTGRNYGKLEDWSRINIGRWCSTKHEITKNWSGNSV